MKKCLLLFAWLCVAAAQAAAPAQLLDDREITVRSVFDVGAKRQALIKYIWGADGFPARRLPDIVVTNVPSPVKMLADLARVDEFRLNMAPGLQGLAYHFIAQHPNRELVVLHHGHGCTFDDDPGPKDVGFGLQRTIAALLREGYGVLAVFMPHKRPGDCTGGHDAMFQMTNVVGSPIRFFLEPTATGLNYLRKQYRAFHMAGLSGGGWTTTVYAAIDPRIQYSFPVAGSIPLYLRRGGSVGDREQFESTFYAIAGYPDLYVLGAHGKGRKQIQILVRHDNCCFGERQHDEKAIGKPYAEAMREYERRVRNVVGNFRLVIDEVGPSHMISHHAIEDVILPELQSVRR